MVPDRRFPGRVYEHGSEPDPRFSLANERTFLAWIRTSLALLAVAGAVLALDLPLARGWQQVGAAVFAAAGLVASWWGWVSWMRTERSLRHERPLPGIDGGAVLGALVGVGVLVLVLGVVLHDLAPAAR